MAQAAQANRLVSEAGARPVHACYIHQMNRMNSRNGRACHDDITTNTVVTVAIVTVIYKPGDHCHVE